MSEKQKYILRFGLVLALVVPVLLFLRGPDALRLLANKLCMVAVAIGLAEISWICFFKKTLKGTNDYTERSVLIFRAVFYAAIIIAFSLGL